MYPRLEIPDTLAAGPGPGNTDPRVLEAFAAAGVADHMQPDVVRGMKEAKFMLREVFGTSNVYTYAVCGTGWSALDCAFTPILSGDKVVSFVNGTFSGIDDLNIRMKASSNEDLAANPLDPKPLPAGDHLGVGLKHHSFAHRGRSVRPGGQRRLRGVSGRLRSTPTRR